MEFKTKDCGFTIDAPANWKYKKQQGIDSYVGDIYIGNNDTIHFDLGYFSNNLDYPFCTRGLDIDDEFVKTKTSFEKINGLNAKFILHKYKNLNDFGIHFDSLWTDNNSKIFDSKDIVKFTIYGRNISRSGQNQIQKVFRTIKFLKFD